MNETLQFRDTLLVMAIFIGIIFIIYMRCCSDSTHEDHATNNSITIDIVDNLPDNLPSKPVLSESKYFQKCYVEGLVIDPLSCPICLEDMQEENAHLLQWRKCEHVVHAKCIAKWINTKGSDIRCLTCHKPV